MPRNPWPDQIGMGVWRDKLDENCATIWMVIVCRSFLRIAALAVARKWSFGRLLSRRVNLAGF